MAKDIELKAYQDKETGLWKWGTRGNPIHETKAAAERAGIDELTDRLRKAREKWNEACANHGK